MYVQLIKDVALLVALTSLQSLFLRLREKGRVWPHLLSGLLFGGVAIVGMAVPFQYQPGIIYDGRSIILALSGLFGGWITTIVSVALAGAFRALRGGAGIWAGLASIAGPAILGLVIRRASEGKPEKLTVLHLYGLGIAAHLVMLASQLLLMPWPRGVEVIRAIWLPIMLIYPMGTALIGFLLQTGEKRVRAEDELREREERYRTLFEESPVAIWEEDFSAVKARFDALRRSGVTDMRAHLDAHPQDVAALAALVRVARVNGHSVRMFGADSPEDLVRSVARYLTPDALPLFREEMIALARGDRTFRAEIPNVRLTGERLMLQLTLSVAPDHADDLSSVLVSFVDITEQRAAEEALALSEANLQSLLASTDDIIVSRDREGRVVAFNEAFARIVRDMFGVDAKPGLRAAEIMRGEEAAAWEARFRKTLMGDSCRGEFSWKVAGRTRVFEQTLTPIRAGAEVIGCAEFTRDITERRRTEEQLLQSQKMETVGQLAGGVAHDFNNILQVILSYVDMSLLQVDPGGRVADYLREVRRAAERSADLTGQLLAYARRQTMSPRVVDMNEAVSVTRAMIQRLIGEDIELAWMPAQALWKTRVDPVQLDQVLANLAVNARDAIGGVGKLTLETANVTFDEGYCSTHAGSVPGEYVLLAVSDDGKGMDTETLSHLFEPFFTTKEMGKGTGLGLATIYGIVKQNKGFISVYSEVGQGSTFKVYLPRAREEGEAQAIPERPPAAGGTETLLVVEDEAAILRLVRDGLGRMGYTVLTATSPGEALGTSAGHEGPIHLLITDVVMPQMNGRQLAERLGELRQGLRCLFMSGYTANVIAHRGVLDRGVSFIAKPFTLDALAAKVREALEG
jgi:PAS domain S-box-containing protein